MVQRLKLVERNKIVEKRRNVISSDKWTYGVFCDECFQPWMGEAPCGECGHYSRPAVLTYRQVTLGSAWAPWTWERRYEFTDEIEQRVASAPDERQVRIG